MKTTQRGASATASTPAWCGDAPLGACAMGVSALMGGALAGCGGDGDAVTPGSGATAGSSVELQIFAANSLEKALPEVQALYIKQTGVTFADTQFKASGDLIEQMRAGAPADVLITASTGTMDTAAQAELVDASTRLDMFANDLVIVRAEGSNIQVGSLEDVANVDGKIAIGDAVTVPAGKYANQALNSVGLYTGAAGDDGEYAPVLADRVALADKVGTAAAYVRTGGRGHRFCIQFGHLPLRRHRAGARMSGELA